MKLFKMLTLMLTAAAITQISADSGKGKVRTAVHDVQQNENVKFKAYPNISGHKFYDLVAKKTGLDREKLKISGVKDSKNTHLSAKKLASFVKHPARAKELHRHQPIGRATRVVTRPVKPVAEVTVVPVADVTDDILFSVYRN